MKKRRYIGKKQKGKSYFLFGKHKGKPVSSAPRNYLYWVMDNLDLSEWEKSVVDAVLYSKTERLIQKEVIKQMDWLK